MKTKINQIIKHRYCLLLFFSLLLQQTYAQEQILITGIITSTNNGDAVPFANILVKNTTNGAVTDMDGKFSITAKSNQTLIISYQGYKTKEVLINNQKTINI